MEPGSFIDSSANPLGVGKLIEIRGDSATVEYFVSPASGARELVEVPADSLRAVTLYAQSRVFCWEPERGLWSAGRLLDGEPAAVSAGGVRENAYLVAFPNRRESRVSASNLFVRWRRPVEEASDWLAARVTETPYLHERRARFIRFVTEQRARFGGLTGLASASIELHRHQIAIARRILREPVQRFLLADEVGLGKTIEAGIVLRQYFLDHPTPDTRALVVVPEHLIEQWESELRGRFHLDEELDKEKPRLVVASPKEAVGLARQLSRLGMLVIDEAHQPARGAFSREPRERTTYDALRNLTTLASRVLLLSATPLLHNENGFLAMLHLLDPEVHRLEDGDRFRKLVLGRQEIAEHMQSLQDDVAGLFLEEMCDALPRLAPEDVRLRELVNQVRSLVDADEEDEQRVRAIRTLRAHLGETYRLDRRLLRTRRDAQGIAEELPVRQGAIRTPHACALRQAAAELLSAWQERASFHARSLGAPTFEEELQALFAQWVEAFLSHPSLLGKLLTRRLGAVQAGGREAFEGECEWLQDTQAALSTPLERDPRLAKLVEVVAGLQAGRHRAVVFVDDPEIADVVEESLLARFPKKVLRAPFEVGTDADATAIVCDRTAEEGLNLQGERSVVVHFDLPLAPNRLEQRTGRIDRIGAKDNVTSIVLLAGTPWETAWVDCLEGAIRVFSRSIAPLQYVLEEQMRTLSAGLLHEGPRAITSASDRMLDGQTGLERELKKIRAQETLDEMDRSKLDEANLFDALEVGDEEDDEAVLDALRHWAEEGLRFERHIEPGGDKLFRYAFALRQSGTNTLLSVADLVTTLRRSIDASAGRRNEWRTFPMVARRRLASRRYAPLLRVGHPFLDGLATLARADDRGVAWAVWRHVPGYEAVGTADVFFRFDFIVEIDLGPARALLAGRQDMSPHAVARRGDEAFPALFHTVWIDLEGQPVRDPRRLAMLEESYLSEEKGGPDRNLNAERWDVLAATTGLLASWAAECGSARQQAEALLRVDADVARQTESHARRLERQAAEANERLRSRVARLEEGAAKASELRMMELEAGLAAALAQGIRQPLVRPDAVGAMFLSGQDPFKTR